MLAAFLTFLWLVACVVTLVLVRTFGPVAAVMLLVGWVLLWMGAYVVTKLVYILRPPKHELFASDERTALGDVWRWHWRTVAYPLVVFPGAVIQLVAAQFAPNEATPDTEDARALRLIGDGRVPLALAVDGDIKVLNKLALMLRREDGVLRINPNVVSTVDVPQLTALVAEMRETTLRQVGFLDLLLPEAPLGEFRRDLTGMVSANAHHCKEAKRFLDNDDARLDAVIQIAQLRVGLSGRST